MANIAPTGDAGPGVPGVWRFSGAGNADRGADAGRTRGDGSAHYRGYPNPDDRGTGRCTHADRVATPTSIPAPGLAVGQTARVAASGGLNVRDQAATTGNQVGKLNADAVVKVIGGPVQGENYTWWQIDDGAGVVGWVAAGTLEDKWLAPDAGAGPATGGGELSNRAVRLGDRVQVTTEEGKVLTVREAAGIDATAVARVLPGTQFVVRGGPVRLDGFLWWQLEGEEVKGWAAEGQEGDRWLTPVEP